MLFYRIYEHLYFNQMLLYILFVGAPLILYLARNDLWMNCRQDFIYIAAKSIGYRRKKIYHNIRRIYIRYLCNAIGFTISTILFIIYIYTTNLILYDILIGKIQLSFWSFEPLWSEIKKKIKHSFLSLYYKLLSISIPNTYSYSRHLHCLRRRL